MAPLDPKHVEYVLKAARAYELEQGYFTYAEIRGDVPISTIEVLMVIQRLIYLNWIMPIDPDAIAAHDPIVGKFKVTVEGE